MKVNIFCRPEEAMLETGEACLPTKIFLFLEKFRLSSPKIMLPNIKRNLHLYIPVSWFFRG